MASTQSLVVRSAWPPMTRVALLVALLMIVTTWPADAASAKVVFSGPRASGAVALTFDDGWGGAACESIARTLRRANVKGTFFINGIHLKVQPARWRKILKGMPVGNHTHSHPFLTRVSSDTVRRQIKWNERVHERVLGRNMAKVFRPPYGAYNTRVLRIAGRLGYRRTVMWNVSAADTSPAATRASIIRRATGARPGSIILMHCARDVTAQALPSIIRHYKRRGIKMVGLPKLLGL